MRAPGAAGLGPVRLLDGARVLRHYQARLLTALGRVTRSRCRMALRSVRRYGLLHTVVNAVNFVEWMVPRRGFEPPRCRRTAGLGIQCVYRFHHLGIVHFNSIEGH